MSISFVGSVPLFESVRPWIVPRSVRQGLRVSDVQGFDAAMAEQKAKARAAWSGTGAAGDAKVWFEIAEDHGVTEFLGYDTETAEGVITALLRDGAGIGQAASGETVQIDGLRIQVLRADSRRVHTLLVDPQRSIALDV